MITESRGTRDESDQIGSSVLAETDESRPPQPDQLVTGSARTESAPHRSRSRDLLATALYRYAVLLVLVAMVVIYSVLMPDVFFTFANLRVITSTQAILMVATLGIVLPFATGEFDLSFGPVIAWASTLLAVLTVERGWSLVPAVLFVLLTCVGWGLVNAFFIVGVGISSLITTLGSGTVIIGLTLAVANQQILAGPPQILVDLSTNQLFGLPYPVYFGLALAAAIWFLLEQTPLGRYMYFTGEGRDVARLSGLSVDRIRVGALAASSGICGLAGIMSFGSLGSADPNLGSTFLLPGTAAVFLGATVIKPGRFNAWGTVIAVYVLVVGVTGLQLMGGAGWLENVFNGCALVLAVSFAHIVSRKTSGSR